MKHHNKNLLCRSNSISPKLKTIYYAIYHESIAVTTLFVAFNFVSFHLSAQPKEINTSFHITEAKNFLLMFINQNQVK